MEKNEEEKSKNNFVLHPSFYPRRLIERYN